MNARKLVPLLLAVSVAAQEKRPVFEVATIKPNHQGPESGFSQDIASNGRFTARNITVWNLIRFAYSLHDRQISGAPGWVKSQGFDIQAQPADTSVPVPREQTLLMLQRLLEDRFQLKLRRETRQVAAYALTVDSRGSKLPPPREGRGRTMFGDFDAPSVTLSSLCQVFEFELDRPVLNKTGLEGPFAIHLKWASERAPKGTADPSLPSLFTALKEELGLVLTTTQATEEVSVIDHIEQPSEN